MILGKRNISNTGQKINNNKENIYKLDYIKIKNYYLPKASFGM